MRTEADISLPCTLVTFRLGVNRQLPLKRAAGEGGSMGRTRLLEDEGKMILLIMDP